MNRTDLGLAGGKGANLGALMHAGLPVPPGFCILTTAYRQFVESNNLEAEITRVLAATQMENQNSLDSASETIRSFFYRGTMPASLADEIREVYQKNTPVAVRSSATAEDLPDMSFAGQQDTYLNIIGIDAVLDAVIRCWASLWTARAIAYRAHNGIPHENVYLAVVVQKMVQSKASGVLFTANPLTEKRDETVIDAIFGLGEALVSGQVEPDHYVVESKGTRLISKTLGAKALLIQGRPEGGTLNLVKSNPDQQAFPDDQITKLTELGQQAQDYFGSPQDMEWAWAAGKTHIVQSRPITSLFPLPSGVRENEVFLSFGVWQGMLDPYTPLGQDVFSVLATGMASLFGFNLKLREQRVFFTAGERLFVNLTSLLKNQTGRMVVSIFIGAIDPASESILNNILKQPTFQTKKKISLRSRFSILGAVAPLGRNVLFNLLWPERGRTRTNDSIEAALKRIQVNCDAEEDLPALIDTIEKLGFGMPQAILPRLVGGIAAGQAPYQILLRLSAKIPNSAESLMGITRGLPYNVTTRMDLDLWRTAQAIRADHNALSSFSTEESEYLIDKYKKGLLAQAAQTTIQKFLSDYGMRGIGEIDLGRPRWNDDPTNLFQTLKSYLQIPVEASPEVVFLRGAEFALQAKTQLEKTFGNTMSGRLRIPLVRFLIRRFRELGGLRETPKFFVVKLLGIFRSSLLKAGQKLVNTGRLTHPDDVFFLHLWELRALDDKDSRDWKTLVAERRHIYEREMQRKRIPRILLSDGSAFYHAVSSINKDAQNILSGSPVSAGVVEGRVRVVCDPHGVQLIPGEILVCPATDPAWTPLFLTAGGLITEVGGMMTHGSVVAREYGIPAVVGVQDATLHLKDGQKIRVDGSSGIISLLEPISVKRKSLDQPPAL